MAAITISRQMGSLGCGIAKTVAERLGFRMVWREVINQAAVRAGVPEMALAMIDELNLLGVRPSLEARRSYLQAVSQLMIELAAQGRVVIVGRAGQVILRGRADVFHVRVMAPKGLRAERLARSKGISIEAAQAQVEASDRSRFNYLRRYHHVDWENPELYDLVVNTERLSRSSAAALIVTAFEQRFMQQAETKIECECE